MSRVDLTRTTVLLELWRTSRRSAAVLEDALAGGPLSPAEFGLYSLLRIEAPLTVTEVARRAGTPVTTTSQALQRLEERGHLRREPNPHDGRSTVVSLTEDGLATHAQVSEAFVPVITAINQRLGSDLETVAYGLVRLDQALRGAAGERLGDAVGDHDEPEAATVHELTYSGEPLTAAEETEARAFVEWLRHRRTTVG